MYAETVLEIWIDIAAAILLVLFVIQGFRKAFRQQSKRMELRMMATVEAQKLRLKEKKGVTEEEDREIKPDIENET